MKKHLVALFCACVAGFALAAPASAQTFSFSSLMLPGNEVAEEPVNSTASGIGFAQFDTSAQTVSWSLTGYVPTGGFRFWHIHRGVAGVNGDVVVNFGNALTGTNVPYASIGAGITLTLVSGIVANPAGFYFNAHSNTFLAGEIRAQLSPVTVPEAGTLPLVSGALALVGGVALRRRKAA